MNLLKLPKREDLIFPKELLSLIVFSFSLFTVFFFLGFYMAVSDSSVIYEQMSVLQDLVEKLVELSPIGLLFFIFLNNSLVALFASLGGIIFSVLPLLIIISNGFLIGIVFHFISSVHSWNFFLGGILPHGLIELPIIILSTAMGLWLGRGFFMYLFFRNETGVSFLSKIRRVFCTYIFIIVPFLFIAALIETFLTSYLLNTFF
jgi:stage II sporulation protein M